MSQLGGAGERAVRVEQGGAGGAGGAGGVGGAGGAGGAVAHYSALWPMSMPIR